MRAARDGDAELLAVCLSLCVCFVRMCALECTHCLCVCVPQELIEVGADAAMANNHGSTPAHGAAAKGHADCLVVLREAGVDLGVAENYKGETPADLAGLECRALLKGWGY